MSDAAQTKLGIIGRERALIDRLARKVYDASTRGHSATAIRQTGRGCEFEVRLYDGSEPTGRVARVHVEMDRVEDVETWT